MSLQNLQADGSLLGAEPQRASVLRWYCPHSGRPALWQQSLRRWSLQSKSGTSTTNVPRDEKKKSRDKNAGFKSHTFQERVLKKNRSLLYAFQNVCLCVWLIRHFSVMACVKQWQEITFAFTAAWTTPPFTSCLWFYLWPCLSVDTLIHGVSQTSVPRVLHRFTNTLTHTKIPTSTWRDFGLGAVIGTD